MMFVNKLKAATAATGLLMLSGIATAQEVGGGTAVDVSSAVDTLTTQGGAAIAAVGGAMLTLAGIAISFKWAKAAFFG